MTRARLLTVILLFIITASYLVGDEYFSKHFQFSIFPPYEWSIVDQSNPAMISFSHPNGTAVVQVIAYSGNSYPDVDRMYQDYQAKLKAAGSKDYFPYQGRQAMIADLEFKLGNYPVKGYVLFIERPDYDFVLLSYSQINSYQVNHDLLLSLLNSFSANQEDRLWPGPISQYYYSQLQGSRQKLPVNIKDQTIAFEYDEKTIQGARILIEREAALIAHYKDNVRRIRGWDRYYKSIYREHYQAMKKLAALIRQNFDLKSKTPLQTAEFLLSWIQTFQYSRSPKTFSDFTSPLASVFDQKSDCDSRAMLYVLLLHQFDIDAILLVSLVYQHSAAAVEVEKKGATVKLFNKNYIFAEMTEVVEMGMIQNKIADITKWIGIRFKKDSLIDPTSIIL